MSVMPISEKHFCIVANSISELKDVHFQIDWHETKALVTEWYHMNEYAYSERYQTFPDAPAPAPDFEKHASKGKVDDVQLLKLLQCILYNIPDTVKLKKWIDAKKKLDRLIEAVTDKIISEQTNYEIAKWAI